MVSTFKPLYGILALAPVTGRNKGIKAMSEYECQAYEEHEEREAEALRIREREEETTPTWIDPVGDALAGWVRSQTARRAA